MSAMQPDRAFHARYRLAYRTKAFFNDIVRRRRVCPSVKP